MSVCVRALYNRYLLGLQITFKKIQLKNCKNEMECSLQEKKYEQMKWPNDTSIEKKRENSSVFIEVSYASNPNSLLLLFFLYLVYYFWYWSDALEFHRIFHIHTCSHAHPYGGMSEITFRPINSYTLTTNYHWFHISCNYVTVFFICWYCSRSQFWWHTFFFLFFSSLPYFRPILTDAHSEQIQWKKREE